LDRTAPDKGPLLWAIPTSVLDDILDDSEDDETGALLNIDNPDKGYDITFTAEGAGKRTCKYKKIRVARKPTSIAEDDEDYNYILDFVEKNSLNKILNYYTFDHIAAKFGVETVETKEESPRRGRRSEPEPEPESEEEESPRRGRRSEPESEEEEENDKQPPFTPGVEKDIPETTGNRLSRFRKNRTK